MACSRACSSMPANSRSAARIAADRFRLFLVAMSLPVPTAPVYAGGPASYTALVSGVRLRVATLFLTSNTGDRGQAVQERAGKAGRVTRLRAALLHIRLGSRSPIPLAPEARCRSFAVREGWGIAAGCRQPDC